MSEMAPQAGVAVLILPMEIPPNYGPRYTTAFRETFHNASTSTGSRLGPFLLEDIAVNPALMQADGIHPVAEAQSLIVDNLESVVRTSLTSATAAKEQPL